MKHFAVMAAVLAGLAGATENADRARLSGSWQTSGAAEARDVWKLTGDGETMQITHTGADGKATEIRCNTLGRECESRQAGKPAKVSMWFNGAKLVVMETRGSDVVKRRFQAVGDGAALEMEIIPIVPRGDPQTIRLTRTPESR